MDSWARATLLQVLFHLPFRAAEQGLFRALFVGMVLMLLAQDFKNVFHAAPGNFQQVKNLSLARRVLLVSILQIQEELLNACCVLVGTILKKKASAYLVLLEIGLQFLGTPNALKDAFLVSQDTIQVARAIFVASNVPLGIMLRVTALFFVLNVFTGNTPQSKGQ